MVTSTSLLFMITVIVLAVIKVQSSKLQIYVATFSPTLSWYFFFCKGPYGENVALPTNDTPMRRDNRVRAASPTKIHETVTSTVKETLVASVTSKLHHTSTRVHTSTVVQTSTTPVTSTSFFTTTPISIETIPTTSTISTETTITIHGERPYPTWVVKAVVLHSSSEFLREL